MLGYWWARLKNQIGSWWALIKTKCWVLGDPGKTKLGFFGEPVKTKGCWVFFGDPVKPKCRGFGLWSCKTILLYSGVNIVEIPSGILDSGRRSWVAPNHYKFGVFVLCIAWLFLASASYNSITAPPLAKDIELHIICLNFSKVPIHPLLGSHLGNNWYQSSVSDYTRVKIDGSSHEYISGERPVNQ